VLLWAYEGDGFLFVAIVEGLKPQNYQPPF
jgi:hypothetical protein